MLLPQQKIFVDLDNFLLQVYKERNLICLEEYKIQGNLAFSHYHKIIDGKKRINEFHSVDLIYDLTFISQDIKYLTGLLFLLRPFINVPSKEGNTYFQNRYDARYMTYSSIVYQNVYNFWDRIGDLLFCFFHTGLSERQVYFSNVLNNLDNKIKSTDNYSNLSKLYDNHLKNLLESRRQIVHYKQLETKHFLGTFQNSEDIIKNQELENEKISYPEYFKEHLNYSNYGFELALNLIQEISSKS